MTDIEFLEIQVRGLENTNRALKQGLWDRFFLAALPATALQSRATGVAAAAEIADEALRVRNERAGIKS